MTTSHDDPVNGPNHYGGNECIEAIETALSPVEAAGFRKGNAMKYIWRAGKKGSYVEDLEKAEWYLQREIGTAKKDWDEEADVAVSKPDCTEDECFCPEKGVCRDYMRLHAQKMYREGIERAGMTAYGPDDDVPVIHLTFGTDLHPSIHGFCGPDDDASVGSPDEAESEVPNRTHRPPSDSGSRAGRVGGMA